MDLNVWPLLELVGYAADLIPIDHEGGYRRRADAVTAELLSMLERWSLHEPPIIEMNRPGF